MRFRLKVTFCMISLMTLLFSIGSCALISRSFQASLAREQTNATESYQLLLNTLQPALDQRRRIFRHPGTDHPPAREPLGGGAADLSGQDHLLHRLRRLRPLPTAGAAGR